MEKEIKKKMKIQDEEVQVTVVEPGTRKAIQEALTERELKEIEREIDEFENKSTYDREPEVIIYNFRVRCTKNDVDLIFSSRNPGSGYAKAMSFVREHNKINYHHSGIYERWQES